MVAFFVTGTGAFTPVPIVLSLPLTVVFTILWFTLMTFPSPETSIPELLTLSPATPPFPALLLFPPFKHLQFPLQQFPLQSLPHPHPQFPLQPPLGVVVGVAVGVTSGVAVGVESGVAVGVTFGVAVGVGSYFP